MYINTNVAAINSQRHVYQTNLDLDRSLERLSSGLRINSAADDASGLAMADKMEAQRTGLGSAIQNTQDSSALFKIAEGALSQVGKMLSRMEELTVRAANKTLTASDRATIGSEVKELLSQIDSVSNQTEYNTMKLLNGNMDSAYSLTVGAFNGNSMRVIDVGNSVKNFTAALVSIGTVGSAAVIAGGGSTGMVAGTITVNGVDVTLIASDNMDTAITKINAQNSRTNVVAVKNAVNSINLISGILDDDAQNIVSGAAVNTSAIGYALTGSANGITVTGNAGTWSAIGINAALFAVGSAWGTNAAASIAGVSLTVTDGKKGNEFTMTNSGSLAYGMKFAINVFNGASGSFILKNQALGSTVIHLTSTGDSATLSVDTATMLRIQTGANYNQNISYGIPAVDTSSIGIGASSKYGALSQIAVDTVENANLSLKVVQKAILDVAESRSAIGSILNRLDYTDKTLQVQRENMASAESKIRDADISLEMTSFTRQQILMQAGTSMLAQANSKPQTILQLLK